MAKKIAKHGHNANYDFKQKAPMAPMGHGSFANMPEKPMFASFAKNGDYRDGLVNSFTCNIDELSKVDENGREQYGHDSA